MPTSVLTYFNALIETWNGIYAVASHKDATGRYDNLVHSADNLRWIRHVRVVEAGELGGRGAARRAGVEHHTSGNGVFSILGTDYHHRREAGGRGGFDEVGV